MLGGENCEILFTSKTDNYKAKYHALFLAAFEYKEYLFRLNSITA